MLSIITRLFLVMPALAAATLPAHAQLVNDPADKPAFTRPTEPEQPATAPQAKALLQASHDAIVEAGGFAADIEFVALTDASLAAMLPDAAGRMQLGQDANDAWQLRIGGQARPFGTETSQDFDVLWSDKAATTVEHAESKVIEGPIRRVRGTMYGTVRQLQVFPAIETGRAPFADLLTNRQAIFELDEDTTFAGEPCSVVRVSHPSRRQTMHVSIALAKSDGMPRRVMRHPTGFDGKMAVGVSLDNIVTGGGPEAGTMWSIATPDGYERDVTEAGRGGTTATQPLHEAQQEDKSVRGGGPASAPPPITPSYALSPNWTATDREGEVVSRESLNGRVTVLYFWGTWCIPCRRAAPLNTQLWDDFGERDDFAMIGMAVRERSEDKVYDYTEENGHDWTQLVNVDNVAQQFGVQRYPTWFVIGPAGELLHESIRPEGGDFEPVFAEIRKAIEKGLGSFDAKPGAD